MMPSHDAMFVRGQTRSLKGTTDNRWGVAPAHQPGEPLPSDIRFYASRRFRHDFSEVRIHSNVAAENAARECGAAAFTLGSDITFARGFYKPKTPTGQRLLAHELAHVVQQRNGIASAHNVVSPSAEADADRASTLFVDGSERVPVSTSTPIRIACQSAGAAASPPPHVPAVVESFTETPIGKGRLRINLKGEVGDAIPRPGLERKYPLPKDVGLPGYDRWHLAGPNATGADEGIFYAPEAFNIGWTAQQENIIRAARAATREQGGDVFFDFTVEVHIQGDVQGVQIRVLDKVNLKIDARLPGSDKMTLIMDETATVVHGTVTPATSKAVGSSSSTTATEQATGAASPQGPKTAEAPKVGEMPQVGEMPRVAEAEGVRRVPLAGQRGMVTLEVAGTIASFVASLLLGLAIAKLQRSQIDEAIKKLEPDINRRLETQTQAQKVFDMQIDAGPVSPALWANASVLLHFSVLTGSDPNSGIPMMTETFLGADLEEPYVVVEREPSSRVTDRLHENIYAGEGIYVAAKETHATFAISLKPFPREAVLAEIDARIARIEQTVDVNKTNESFPERERLLEVRKLFAMP